MATKDSDNLEAWDKTYLWHPFTQMSSFLQESPLIIKEARGIILKDVYGKEYIDGVSSLWCNIHGHRKKEIDRAIKGQLKQVAHSTLLGVSNIPSVTLAKRLVEIAPKRPEGHPPLTKVFYSDNGSTAVEVALKMAFQYWQQSGHPEKRKFLALQYAYHGDTLGAVAVGGIPQFHDTYRPLTFSPTLKVREKPEEHPNQSPPPLVGGGRGSELYGAITHPVIASEAKQSPNEKGPESSSAPPPETVSPSPGGRGKGEGGSSTASISPPPYPPPSRGRESEYSGAATLFAPSPYCYRCPLGKDKETCQMACLGEMERILSKSHRELAAVIIEPLVQGAGGMIVHPQGYLKGVRELCGRYNVLLIADEVLTGFGRTGKMFACEHEGVVPDIMCLSKGLTGGYLPLAATLVTEDIFNAFLGDRSRTFYHGHTFTGNPLACAAALASLEIFQKESVLRNLQPKIELLRERLKDFYELEHVGDVRQGGLIAGIELVKDRKTKESFPPSERIGHRVILEAGSRGALLRPLGDVIVIMPPLSITLKQLERLVDIVYSSIKAVVGSS
jgi:adenosylmethionine-8-amino-7-oxononanoate aminotransferase